MKIKSAAAIEEVLASVQEQIATVELLVGISEGLNENIKEMNLQINRFVIVQEK